MKGFPQIAAVAVLTCAVAFVPSDKKAGAIVLQNCTLTPSARHHAPRIRNRNGTSSNWGAYAAQTSLTSPQKNAVSAVHGTWVVPTVSASTSADTYSAFWVGIDGYSDNTVEQLGTEQDWSSGAPVYSVWFEMYPHNSYNITGFPIEPGDTFSASVNYAGGGLFILSITNVTKGVAYTVPTKNTKMNNAERESAEWIVEAPWSGGVLPLADFSTASFSNCTATVNGITGAVDNPNWQYDDITMASGSVVKALPSALTDSTVKGTTSSAFTASWFHE